MTERVDDRAAPAVGSALPPLVKVVTQEMIDRYATASGDDNPLHTNPEFAAGTQFGGTIAHGMLVLAYLSEMMTDAFGLRWLSSGGLKVRFRVAACPGDTVTASGRVLRKENSRTYCAVECRNQHGEVLISAEAEVAA